MGSTCRRLGLQRLPVLAELECSWIHFWIQTGARSWPCHSSARLHAFPTRNFLKPHHHRHHTQAWHNPLFNLLTCTLSGKKLGKILVFIHIFSHYCLFLFGPCFFPYLISESCTSRGWRGCSEISFEVRTFQQTKQKTKSVSNLPLISRRVNTTMVFTARTVQYGTLESFGIVTRLPVREGLLSSYFILFLFIIADKARAKGNTWIGVLL